MTTLKDFLENWYSNRIIDKVKEAQKKYNFDMPNNSTHNNEADAFRHTFAFALVSMEEGQNIYLYL